MPPRRKRHARRKELALVHQSLMETNRLLRVARAKAKARKMMMTARVALTAAMTTRKTRLAAQRATRKVGQALRRAIWGLMVTLR